MEHMLDTLTGNPVVLAVGVLLLAGLLLSVVLKLVKLAAFVGLVLLCWMGYLHFAGKETPSELQAMEEKVTRVAEVVVEKVGELGEKVKGGSDAPANDTCLDERYHYGAESLAKNQELVDLCVRFSIGESLDACTVLKDGTEYCWGPVKGGWHGWSTGMLTQLERKKKAENGRFCIVVDKAAYELKLYGRGKLLQSSPMDLGENPYDDKVSGGKECTPEGLYAVEYKEYTKYHEALLLGYPNISDKKEHGRLRKEGKIGHGLGKWLEIHGHDLPDNRSNWTDGCVAISDEFMDRLYEQMGLPASKALATMKASQRRNARKEIRRIESQTLVAIVKYSAPESSYCPKE